MVGERERNSSTQFSFDLPDFNQTGGIDLFKVLFLSLFSLMMEAKKPEKELFLFLLVVS